MSDDLGTTPTEQHLLPQLTLRSVLLWFTLSILGAWVIRQATLDSQWAMAIVVALAATAGFFLIYAFLFLIVWLPAELVDAVDTAPAPAPADSDTQEEFPPQLIPPRARNVAS